MNNDSIKIQPNFTLTVEILKAFNLPKRISKPDPYTTIQYQGFLYIQL